MSASLRNLLRVWRL